MQSLKWSHEFNYHQVSQQMCQDAHLRQFHRNLAVWHLRPGIKSTLPLMFYSQHRVKYREENLNTKVFCLLQAQTKEKLTQRKIHWVYPLNPRVQRQDYSYIQAFSLILNTKFCQEIEDSRGMLLDAGINLIKFTSWETSLPRQTAVVTTDQNLRSEFSILQLIYRPTQMRSILPRQGPEAGYEH